MHRNKLILIFILFVSNIYSQCAMCKAGAEQSLQRGATDAAWINYGILFLMSSPLVIIGVIYYMYRRNEKNKK